MARWSFLAIQIVVIGLYSGVVQARPFCGEVFVLTREFSVEAPPSVRTQRAENRTGESAKTSILTNVFRDRDLLESLVRNKKYPAVEVVTKSGDRYSWFLSLSSNGRLYRMVVKHGTLEKVADMFADVPTEKVEKFYYKWVVDRLEMTEFRTTINLPRKGKRELVILPSILVKLEVKHDISVEQLVEVLRKVPPKVEYRPNHAQHLAGQESFLFFVDVGQRVPLEIVMVYTNSSYLLLTAFFPEVYHHTQ